MGIKEDVNLLVNKDRRRVVLEPAVSRNPITGITNRVETAEDNSPNVLVPPLKIEVTEEEKIEVDVVPNATKVEVSRAIAGVLTDAEGKSYTISTITWPS